MEKEFVPYELAVKLKALGFDEPCFGIYLMKEFRYSSPPMSIKDITDGIDVLAPTFSQAFRFFREKYGLFHSIDTRVSKDIGYLILLNDEEIHIDSCYWNYEEAELACLEKLIEIVESKSE
jgi:hypothetical protein